MSQPSSVETPVQKQKLNVYTVMLIVSFLCISIACILLWMELSLWGSYPWWNTSSLGATSLLWSVPVESALG